MHASVDDECTMAAACGSDAQGVGTFEQFIDERLRQRIDAKCRPRGISVNTSVGGL
jgi:hypothetical protein